MTRAIRLRALEGGGDERAAMRAAQLVPTLNSRPFRPGELPIFVALELGDDMAGAMASAAAARGVPVELYTRLAIEAACRVDEVAPIVGDASAVVELLDVAAMQHGRSVGVIEGRQLAAYASALLRGGAAARATTATAGPVVEVAISCEMATSWAASAAAAGQPLNAWASDRAAAAPAEAVAWEAAAARAGRTLAEWVYSEAAASLSLSRAAPQRRA